MTHAEHLRAAIAAAEQKKGAKLSREEADAAMNATVAGLIAAAVPQKKRAPKGAKRERNPLFDALALATGTRDLTQMTRNAAKECGVALADIMAVTPDLTVEEIDRRAAAYRRKWPDPRNLTPLALAKRWGEFAPAAGEARTRAAQMDVYQEPAGEWRVHVARVYGYKTQEEIPSTLLTIRWADVSTDIRAAALRLMAAERRESA